MFGGERSLVTVWNLFDPLSYLWSFLEEDRRPGLFFVFNSRRLGFVAYPIFHTMVCILFLLGAGLENGYNDNNQTE